MARERAWRGREIQTSWGQTAPGLWKGKQRGGGCVAGRQAVGEARSGLARGLLPAPSWPRGGTAGDWRLGWHTEIDDWRDVPYIQYRVLLAKIGRNARFRISLLPRAGGLFRYISRTSASTGHPRVCRMARLQAVPGTRYSIIRLLHARSQWHCSTPANSTVPAAVPATPPHHNGGSGLDCSARPAPGAHAPRTVTAPTRAQQSSAPQYSNRRLTFHACALREGVTVSPCRHISPPVAHAAHRYSTATYLYCTVVAASVLSLSIRWSPFISRIARNASIRSPPARARRAVSSPCGGRGGVAPNMYSAMPCAARQRTLAPAPAPSVTVLPLPPLVIRACIRALINLRLVQPMSCCAPGAGAGVGCCC